jgi:Tfp pilus assembly protein PilF
MSDLFVSYASEDREVVRKIVSAFEAQGWKVWWDRHINVGSSFDQRIEDAIDEARCIVVVWSRYSVRSEWVRAEAAEGLERNILVPILIDDVKPPLLFRQRQSISLVDWRYAGKGSQELDELLPSISPILESYKQSTLPVSTQRAWALGRIVGRPEIEHLAHASYVALSLGLSYLDNLFLYTSEFRGSAARSLGIDDLESLVNEEGLNGFIYGEIQSAENGVVFKLNVQHAEGEREVRSVYITSLESLAKGIGECLLASAEILQGYRPRDADVMLDFLADRNTRSLELVWHSYQYADENDYVKVKESCEAALRDDPRFGLARVALATAYQYLGRVDDAKNAISQAITHSDKESKASVARVRSMYFAMYSEDYERAAEEFGALIRISPLDESAINNLAVCTFYQLKFDQARELSARDLSLYPDKKIGLQNAAFYSLYAGALEEAEHRAQLLFARDPNYVNCQVVRGLVRAEMEDIRMADDLYASALSGEGRNDAVLLQARADLAIAREDMRAAAGFLDAGLALDRERGNSEYAARKLLMSAEIALASDPVSRVGLERIREAVASSTSVATLAIAAFICIRFDVEPLSQIESALRLKVGSHGRAYAKMLSGYIEQRSGDIGTAKIDLDEAIGIADLWLIRLGRAILFDRAGLPLEASDELKNCLRRRGESLSAVLDEQPTYRYARLARDLKVMS